MSVEDVERTAKRHLERAEHWHKRLNIKEIVFGFQDNSIAILVLLAGVTGGALQRGPILLAGMAAVFGGAIAVGIANYISSKSELEYFECAVSRESSEVNNNLPVEREEVRQIYKKKAPFTDNELSLIVNRITADKKTWLDTMLKEEIGLTRERFVSPLKAAIVMTIAETIGGLVPLTPYLVIQSIQTGFIGAIAATYTALFVIGVWKTSFTEKNWLRSGLEMVTAGIIATAIPYYIGALLSSLTI
jgi:predicted membrane protein (TIGR00267 family)